MTFKEVIKISHRELTANRAKGRAMVITVGVLFGVLLAVLFVFQGAENLAMRYAEEADGQAETCNRIDWEKPYNPETASHQEKVCRYFRWQEERAVQPISITLMVIAALVLAMTMAHFIASQTQIIVLYRSLGASKKQILGIYFGVLMEACAKAVIFALVLAVVLAGVVSAIAGGMVQGELMEYYASTMKIWPILLGVNWQCVWVVLGMFAVAPMAFLLCLDQFSGKKIAVRLKGD